MRSGSHFVISIGIGLFLWGNLRPGVSAGYIVTYSGLIGVLIDIDHFGIARWNSGSWQAVDRCWKRPQIVFLDQDAIFDENEVKPLQRLFTHLLLGSLLTAAIWITDPLFGLVTGTVIGAHLVTDLVDDIRHSRYSDVLN